MRAGLAMWSTGLVVSGCASAPPSSVAVVTARPDHAEGEPDELLSATGLYKDIAHGTVSTDVIEYTPRFPFWSDGAGMRRYARFPPGARIDVKDMDHWSFPQGTRFWKTFDVGGVVVETDLIERTGPNPGDVRFTAHERKRR